MQLLSKSVWHYSRGGLGPATLLQAVKVPRPNLFAMGTYIYRYRMGDASMRVVKIGLTQNRRSTLTVTLPPEPSRELQAEVEMAALRLALAPWWETSYQKEQDCKEQTMS